MDAHAAPFCFCCEALVLLNTDYGAGISIGKLFPTKAAKAGKIGNKACNRQPRAWAFS